MSTNVTSAQEMLAAAVAARGAEDPEIVSIKRVLKLLDKTAKSNRTYGSANPVAQKFLHQLFEELTTHLITYSKLTFLVQRTALLCKECVVYQAEQDGGGESLAFKLYADGIRELALKINQLLFETYISVALNLPYQQGNLISLLKIIPPLRERRDDIPLLAYFLLRKFAVTMDRPVKEISAEAMQRLVEYDYPGNVRELSNFIERGVALAQGETLDLDLPQHLGRLTVRVFTPAIAAAPATLKAQEKEHILNALAAAKGNRSEAARMLGIDRVSLWRKLKKYGM